MRKSFFSVIFLALTLLASAQSLPKSQQRQAYLAVARAIEDYELYSDISPEGVNDFVALFSEPGKVIYNDLLGLSDSKTLLAETYAQLMSSQVNTVRIAIKEVERGNIYNDNGKWLIPVRFLKEIRYYNRNNVLLSSSQFYGKDHMIDILYRYFPEENVCRIESLAGSIDSDRRLSDDFYVIVASDSLVTRFAKVDGEKINYNEEHQYLVSSGYKVEPWDYDLYVDQKIDPNHFVTLSFHKIAKRIQPRAAISLGGNSLICRNESGLISSTKSYTYEAGADLGVGKIIDGVMKAGWFVGVAYSQSLLDVRGKDDNYVAANFGSGNLPTTMSLTNVSQQFRIQEVAVPIYFDAYIPVTEMLAIGIDAGVKPYVNLSFERSAVTASVRASDGVNEDFFLENMSFTSFPVSMTSQLPAFSLSVFGGVGLAIRINDRIAPFLRFDIEQGVTQMYSSERTLDFEHQFFVPETKDNTVLFQSLDNFSLTRRTFFAGAGIRIKF